MTQSVKVANGHQLASEIAAWLASVPDEYVACREARHAWPIDPESRKWKDDTWQGRLVWVREWACMHLCGVTRTMRRDYHTGEYLGSTYLYPSPDGGRSNYLLPIGAGSLTSDDLFYHQIAEQRPAKKRSRKG